MNKKVNKIREIAQRCAEIEFGNFGTIGGHEKIYDFILKLKGTERQLFVEFYLAELRIRLLAPDFDPDTRFLKRKLQFNPRP